jgi:hypothetical protein
MAENFIYAYTHTGHAKAWQRSTGQKGNSLIKVGQTSKPGMSRVREQLGTAFPDLNGVEVFFHSEEAVDQNGQMFTDHDVHRLLVAHGIERKGGEWFAATLEEIKAAVISLQRGVAFNTTRIQSFKLRPEQIKAVRQTVTYFKKNESQNPKFLWNAKMRFGKTFTSYHLVKEMGWKKVLVLTYKPAVRNAWRDDLLSHVDFTDWTFADRDTPKAEAEAALSGEHPTIWFASFQDVTGKDLQGKTKPRNAKLAEIDWDCIIIDEFHFGASTSAAKEVYDPQDKSEAAIAHMFIRESEDELSVSGPSLETPDSSLKTRFHLHLSGTPFKAITNGQYSEDQVFNWTYIDEQREKSAWDVQIGENPYLELPQMQMFSYKLGDRVRDWISDGEFDGFNLNTYFRASKVEGKYEFERPDYAQAFLDLIRGKQGVSTRVIADEKTAPYPYQSAKFRSAVKHSIWYMNDIASCEAMAELLRNDNFFSDFEIYVAAGTKAKTGAAALLPLQRAIAESVENRKLGSITISCGKLMTGVTVPEWTSIFMLKALKAPESYFQAAFRVQSPWKIEGQIVKETSYIFEFDPNRALNLIARYGTELALSANGNVATQETVLSDLINFLPIFAVDDGGMEALDVNAILEWAHGGLSANSLARRWGLPDLYNLNESSMSALLEDEDLVRELEQIEDFRKIRQQAQKIITTAKRLKTVKPASTGSKANNVEKREVAKQRQALRDKLKKVSAKVLIFMYLTDFREERFADVINSLDKELFLRSTGLSIEGYSKLAKIGMIDEANMTDAIQKFRYFEMSSLRSSLQIEDL